MKVRQVLLDAGIERLRPILITSCYSAGTLSLAMYCGPLLQPLSMRKPVT